MKHPAKLRLRLRGAAALLALLALAAGAVFALRGRAQAAEWAFEPEPGQVFAAFGNSFAACSSTQLQIYGPEGELCLRAGAPAACARPCGLGYAPGCLERGRRELFRL